MQKWVKALKTFGNLSTVSKIDESFSLSKTMECGQCFHFTKLNNNEYLVYGLNDICWVKQIDDFLYIKCNDIGYWTRYFSLDMDYKEIINYLYDFANSNNDEYMKKCIEFGKGIRILRQPLFEIGVSYIISQRNNIPRIQNTVFNISNKLSSNKLDIGGNPFYMFPSLSDFVGKDLTSFNLGYRDKYIIDFVNKFETLQKSITHNYEQDVNLLMEINGIGIKVANCICLFGLEEYDAFPIDVWMQKILDEEYKNKKINIPDKYAGILQQFMFYTRRTM